MSQHKCSKVSAWSGFFHMCYSDQFEALLVAMETEELRRGRTDPKMPSSSTFMACNGLSPAGRESLISRLMAVNEQKRNVHPMVQQIRIEEAINRHIMMIPLVHRTRSMPS